MKDHPSSQNPGALASRREFLWHLGGGLGGIALSHLLGQQRLLAALTNTGSPVPGHLSAKLHHPPKVKRVIQLFMNGGASQMDLFDHKPALFKRHGEKFDPGTKARVEARYRNSTLYGAIVVAVAPDPGCCGNAKPAVAWLLKTSGPARAGQLSKAGRHWTPIARQRATRKERHSGLTGPTYCNKPNWAPPSSTACCALSPGATAAIKPKTRFLIGRFS